MSSTAPLRAAAVPIFSAPTPAPALPEQLIRRQTQQSTNYFSIYDTLIPDDKYFMGMGRAEFANGDTSDYWIACTDDPYTVSAGYAGCGLDDLYTACAGDVARAKDGTDITCRASLGFACSTAEIYDDLDATDYTSWIKCGISGETTALVRTPTGVSTTLSALEATTDPAPPSAPTRTDASDSSATVSTTGQDSTSTSTGSGSSLKVPILAILGAVLTAVVSN